MKYFQLIPQGYLPESSTGRIFAISNPTNILPVAQENGHKRSISCDIGNLRNLLPWIGNLELNKVNMGTLQPWLVHMNSQNLVAGTINHGLKIVRRILKLASSEWMDEYGLTWIAAAPKIPLLPDLDKRQPYPLEKAQFRGQTSRGKRVTNSSLG